MTGVLERLKETKFNVKLIAYENNKTKTKY